MSIRWPEADLDAARPVDGLANRLWHDALLRGHYPPEPARAHVPQLVAPPPPPM